MIKKEEILIWTLDNKSLFCKEHKSKNQSNKLKNDFKDIDFTDFEMSEKDLIKDKNNYTELTKYTLSKEFMKRIEIENINYYKVIIFDLQCSLVGRIDSERINFSPVLFNSFIANFLLPLITKHKNKIFLILNADLNGNWDYNFNTNKAFDTIKLEKKRSTKIKSLNQINIDEKIVSFYCLNDEKIRERLNNQKTKKEYRPLWHVTGNKNDIAGFQFDNMYFLPFGCDALPSILKNIDALLNDSNKINK